MAATMTAQTSQLKSFTGMRAARPVAAAKAPVMRAVRSRRSVVTQAGFIGSSENVIMVVTTTAFLAAGRFGLAPTTTRHTTAGLKLYEDKAAGLVSNDPAGFNLYDTLALGALGHVVGVGSILGLRAIGAI